MALERFGTNNIAEVQTYLPHKTITDIRLAFEKYSSLAAEKLRKEEKSKDDDSAINAWIQVAKEACDKSNGIADIVPRVLKYIALFEKRANDREVDLKECYVALSDLCGGKTSKNLSSSNSHFLFGNLSRLAMKIKKTDSNKKKQFISSFNNFGAKPQTIKTYNRKKKKETSVILNPLNVPNELLKIEEESVLHEGRMS